MSGARRQDDRAVVAGQLGIGRVELGVIPARPGHPGPQVVGHGDRGHAAIERPGPHVGAHPAGEVLAPGRLGVEHAAGPEHGHEHLGRAHLAGGGVGVGGFVAGEVDEHALPGGVAEAHDHVLGREPALVVQAELAVAPSLGMVLPPLQPQQAQGDMATLLQLPVDLTPLRHRPPGRQLAARRREELGLQGRLVEALGQGPGQTGRLGPGQVLEDRRPARPDANGDVANTDPGGLQPQDLGDLAHG